MYQFTPEGCVLTEDEDCLDIDSGLFTVEDFQAAKLNTFKIGKASGVDGIDANMLNVDPELAARYLCALSEHIRENVKVPHEWKKAMIVKIPKKGDLTVCDNFEGNSSLSVLSKVLDRVVIERIRKALTQS